MATADEYWQRRQSGELPYELMGSLLRGCSRQHRVQAVLAAVICRILGDWPVMALPRDPVILETSRGGDKGVVGLVDSSPCDSPYTNNTVGTSWVMILAYNLGPET
jgi:hypothetical protein